MRPGNVVKGMKKHHMTSQVLDLFTEAQALSSQWRQRLPKCQIEPFKIGGAHVKAQAGQSLCTTPHSCGDAHQSAFALFFDQLPIDQVWMRFFDRLSRTARLSSPLEGFDLVIASDQGLEIAAEAVAEKAWDA